ncbi:MAG TPA: glycosyl hydrolase [Mycobacteriales bacterium]|nr:glycosyl hydrolase [Mycobacteriales bacterium]
MSNWSGRGYRMVWGVPMLPLSGATLATGASGAYDQYYVTVAKDLVAHGMGNAILRLGWEFNQKSYPWYAAGQAPAFVAYWRHIVNAMRGVSGASFVFEWNPSLGDNGGGDKAMGDLTSYYPGDAYVDIMALDVYDIAWNNYPGEPAQFSSIKSRKWGLDWLASFAGQHSKQVAIAEFGLGWGASAGNGQPYAGTGTVSGGDNPRFIADMAAWMRLHNAIISGYWDKDFSSIENGHNPLTAAEIATQFGGSATSVPTTSPSPTVSPTTSPSPTVSPTTSPRPTKKHGNHSRLLLSRLTLHAAVTRADAIKIRGALLPAQDGHKLTIQTKAPTHAAHWRTLAHTLTQANGRYHAVLPRHQAHYLRVATNVGHDSEHSRRIIVG